MAPVRNNRMVRLREKCPVLRLCGVVCTTRNTFRLLLPPLLLSYLKDCKSSKIGQDKRKFSVVPPAVFSRDSGLISLATSLPPSIPGF